MKTEIADNQTAAVPENRMALCDHPKTPGPLVVAEAKQRLLDGALSRVERQLDGWGKKSLVASGPEGTLVESYHGSIGLTVLKNYEGLTMAAVVDSLLVQMELTARLAQTLAMLPRWAGLTRLAALLREVPQALAFERWELSHLQRFGLITGAHYDEHRRCMIWETTELLAEVVRTLEAAEHQTSGLEEERFMTYE